ncbi:hypothetical protein L7F22_005745 [Adiantum nelumboides]|nr:hypothetical protein [Adiantum nelumboides]
MSTHASRSAHVSAIGTSASKSNVGSSSKKRKGAQGPLASAFSLQARKQVDQALCRFFYAEDILEWKVWSPFFLEMVKAIGQVGPSYVPPTYNALCTTELNDEVNALAMRSWSLKTGSYASLFNGRTVFIINGVQGKLYWAFSVEDDYVEGSTKIRSKSPEEMKQRLLSYYEGFSLATSIIQVTEPELILERRVLDLPVLSTWFQGNTVLLGDAVHAVTPSLGQGANLAFEDGMQLAKLLVSSADLRSALEKYQALQMPRARQISKQSQTRDGKPEDAFYDWLYSPKML